MARTAEPRVVGWLGGGGRLGRLARGALGLRLRPPRPLVLEHDLGEDPARRAGALLMAGGIDLELPVGARTDDAGEHGLEPIEMKLLAVLEGAVDRGRDLRPPVGGEAGLALGGEGGVGVILLVEVEGERPSGVVRTPAEVEDRLSHLHRLAREGHVDGDARVVQVHIHPVVGRHLGARTRGVEDALDLVEPLLERLAVGRLTRVRLVLAEPDEGGAEGHLFAAGATLARVAQDVHHAVGRGEVANEIVWRHAHGATHEAEVLAAGLLRLVPASGVHLPASVVEPVDDVLLVAGEEGEADERGKFSQGLGHESLRCWASFLERAAGGESFPDHQGKNDEEIYLILAFLSRQIYSTRLDFSSKMAYTSSSNHGHG